jgi:exopolyphosphatase / guanosine-5'-triphosphate,3'-diphosphate pyrophosphatase
MSTIGAIDVGSNAMRLAVASVNTSGKFTVLESLRAPVRLGTDVFSEGFISEASIEKTVGAFARFRTVLEKHGVTMVKAVATSATREAHNRDIFIDRIKQRSGIELIPITSDEEARLILRAIQSRLDLKKRKSLSIDIGGGSVEFTLSFGETIIATQGYRIGTVRLLNALQSKTLDQEKLVQLINEYIYPVLARARAEIGYKGIEVFIGTGGNVEALTDMRVALGGKNSVHKLTAGELAVISMKLQGMSLTDRVRQLHMRPDRADVILPAAIILQRVLQDSGLDVIQIPKVGVKEGLLLDLAEEVHGDGHGNPREQVLSSAFRIGRKYCFEEEHGLTVARHAMVLFDTLQSLHNLPNENRLLLEIAALLHDIGSFISLADHHKHSMYLLLSNPVIGLTQQQLKIVANVARYHRKSMPKPEHEEYQSLAPKDRVTISKLASILRLADAMDHEHGARVRSFIVESRLPNVNVELAGDGDMLLEKWSLLRKSEMFEKVFGVKFSVKQ